MTNVVDLFPNATDEEYEDHILPILVSVLGHLHDAADRGQYDVIEGVSASLLDYSMRSMLFLDECRKFGMFKDNRFPDILTSAIDNLAADGCLAMGGEGAEEVAESLRNRSPTKRSKR